MDTSITGFLTRATPFSVCFRHSAYRSLLNKSSLFCLRELNAGTTSTFSFQDLSHILQISIRPAMIQRIQTLYLFLSTLAAILLYFQPVYATTTGGIDEGMQVIGAGTHLLLLPVPALIIVSHLFTIFAFKNRSRQKRLCTGNILLYLIFLLGALLIIQLEHQFFQHFNLLEFRWGILLPVAGIILNILAKRGIRQDEALLRSMDRLR